jgi:hypothetical protein
VLLEIETAIIKHLEATLHESPVLVRGFPDTPEGLGRIVPRGQILVAYKSATFRETSIAPIAMEAILDFEVSMQLSDLRSHSGAYPILDLIRAALTGFYPVVGASKPLLPKGERFADLDASTRIWYYVQNYQLSLVWPADYSAAEPREPWEFLGVRAGVWRSPIETVPQRLDLALLDREMIIDGDT